MTILESEAAEHKHDDMDERAFMMQKLRSSVKIISLECIADSHAMWPRKHVFTETQIGAYTTEQLCRLDTFFFQRWFKKCMLLWPLLYRIML